MLQAGEVWFGQSSRCRFASLRLTGRGRSGIRSISPWRDEAPDARRTRIAVLRLIRDQTSSPHVALIDRILRGADPADITVEQPAGDSTEFIAGPLVFWRRLSGGSYARRGPRTILRQPRISISTHYQHLQRKPAPTSSTRPLLQQIEEFQHLYGCLAT
jgi:hypothetical protein